jgi:hypothetical protein
VITDDEVMQLFAQADPARVSDVAPTVDAAAYLDALRTRSTDMTLVENPPPRSDGKPRTPRWLLMSAAAAVVVVVLGALVVANRDDSAGVMTDQTPVATSFPPAPEPAAAPTEAETVAANFLAAYAAYDADAAAAFLPADADVSGLWNRATDWRLELQYMQATGLRLMVSGCEERGSSSTGVVQCPFEYHALRSEELGLGPYGDSSISLTVRDGKIASRSMQVNYIRNGFDVEMWSPFYEWVSAAYPDDAAAMYVDDTQERITPDSIPLWEQRTREYVQVAQGPYVAEATQICRAATDRLVSSSDGAGADTERAARLAEQSLAELRSLPLPEGDAALASWVDQLIARSGQYIDVLDQIAAFEAGAIPQELVTRRVALTVQLDAMVPGIVGCPIRLT